MIARLRGTLIARQPPSLLVEVAGVGYEMEAPISTIYDLPEPGSEVTLLTQQFVRDDRIVLYGFATESERALFRELIKVSGIGPKIALAILSGISADEFARLVHDDDVAALTRIPGIGKKTAGRLIVELRDRIGDAITTGSASLPGSAAHTPADARGEAVVALQQLGYKPAEAARLTNGVADDGDDTEAIIRKALRLAMGK